jgi:hypothetical protein
MAAQQPLRTIRIMNLIMPYMKMGSVRTI